ncbi:MAG: hypothetical protein PUA69_07215 [Erysipelotrichaceae bacterium]|jgi:REP element-mobilizing transposase RayT|nr:hypothetical protein [Erysipelotrichaceae bacterium]
MIQKPLLSGNVSSVVKKNNWEILAMETDVGHIHVLLEYDTRILEKENIPV